MDNGKVLNKVDNKEFSGDSWGFSIESEYYYHIYDSEHGHLLFTEKAIGEAKERVARKQLLLSSIETDNPPWWKVWA